MFVIVVPFLGLLIYLIAHAQELGHRDEEAARASQAQFDDYVRSVAGSGGAAAEIEKAKQLLDSGAITQAEFDTIKAKAVSLSGDQHLYPLP
ncbi:MAG TPA: SHOCT domain-containing protein [Solirubrobacterales bacterium]|nr:SHOCT domain-containing protein [Solirubrobacterales bacterium]